MIYRFLTAFIIIVCITSCGVYKKSNARKSRQNAQDRARKNVEEGRGVSLKGIRGKGSTTYEFSTSNPMWRASLSILDFLPLTTVDYSGGIIITDWYNDASSKNDSIKITIRFLSNEIRTNSLKIIVHQKKCAGNANCIIKKIDSKIQEELISQILAQATLIEKTNKENKK